MSKGWSRRSGGWIWRRRLNKQTSPLLLSFLIAAPGVADQKEDRWWPVQSLPKAVVRTQNQQDFPTPRPALQMMVQSVAGLAAKAVNKRQGDEMVWVNNENIDLEDWLSHWLALHPDVEKRGTFGPWDLVDRYAERGVIKGYILYRLDKSRGESNAYRPGTL